MPSLETQTASHKKNRNTVRFYKRKVAPKPTKLAVGFEREATRFAVQRYTGCAINPQKLGPPFHTVGFGLSIIYSIVIIVTSLLLLVRNVNIEHFRGNVLWFTGYELARTWRAERSL